MSSTLTSSEIEEQLACLLHPEHLWSPKELLANPSIIPARSGVYGWFFRNIPSLVPVTGCVRVEGFTLLYLGIAPSEPSSNGKISGRTIRDRIVGNHLKGNARGSTLRLSLGCLLGRQLGISLDHADGSRSLHFCKGERILSSWMEANAKVCWITCEEPWSVEKIAISRLSLPLNLEHNRNHPFYAFLKGIRKDARAAVHRSVDE